VLALGPTDPDGVGDVGSVVVAVGVGEGVGVGLGVGVGVGVGVAGAEGGRGDRPGTRVVCRSQAESRKAQASG
jgi:hypothetical protein